MEKKFDEAVTWVLNQKFTDDEGNKYEITEKDSHLLVDKVREYFNENGIKYDTFSYDDLKPYLTN